MKPFVPIIVESPYRHDTPLNLQYLRACLRDCVLRGETPYASHALLTQPGVLRDEVADERALGIRAGGDWRPFATLTAFYEDLGWSSGMYTALHICSLWSLRFERRTLGPQWRAQHFALIGECASREHWRLSCESEPGGTSLAAEVLRLRAQVEQYEGNLAADHAALMTAQRAVNELETENRKLRAAARDPH